MDGSSVLTRRYVTNSSIYVIPDPFIFWFKNLEIKKFFFFRNSLLSAPNNFFFNRHDFAYLNEITGARPFRMETIPVFFFKKKV